MCINALILILIEKYALQLHTNLHFTYQKKLAPGF